MMKRVEIAGVKFDPIRYADVLTAIEVFAKQKKQHMIVTPNPEMLVEAKKNGEFIKVLNHASLSVPDGIGILWAAYYLSLPKAATGFLEFFRVINSLFKVLFKSKKIYDVLPERVTGSDLLVKIVEESQKHGWRIYFLGAAPGVGKQAIEKLLKKYPQAIFAGSFAGSPGKNEEKELCEKINLAEPDLLFVAYGSPAQEQWIDRNLTQLKTVKVAIGIGGAIDFAAGKMKRSPKWMQKIGLEWLWRLALQPKRIKRIWTATVVFVKMIVRSKHQ